MHKLMSHSIAQAVNRQGISLVDTCKLSLLVVALLASTSTPALSTTTATSNNNDQHTNLHSAELCLKLNQRTNRVRVKPVAKPPYNRLFKEPGFGTNVKRISNSELGSVTKPGSNAAQAWNSDESRLMLHHYNSNGDHSVMLLDGHSYETIGTLKLPTLAAENIHWSNQDPNTLFYVADTGDDAGKLSKLNIATGEKALIKNFAPYCEKSRLPAQGAILAAPSKDDKLFGFRCGINNDNSLALSYNANSDEVHTLKLGNGTRWSNDHPPRPFPVDGTIYLGDKILNSKLKASNKRLDIANAKSPSAIGMSSNQENRFFQSATTRSPKGCSNDVWNGVGLVVKHDVQNNSCAALVTQTKGYPETPSGAELAANAYQNPKWLAMASLGYEDFDWFTKKRGAPLLFSEVVLLDTEQQEPAPCRLAHTRSYGEEAKNAAYELSLGKPSVSLSPTATRVLFSSDWYDSGSIDTYVVVLPAYTKINVQGTWVDAYNNNAITQFAQVGEMINFRREIPSADPNQTVLITGNGEINAEKLELRYEYMQSEDRVVRGSCKGTQSADQTQTTLNCQNDIYGSDSIFNLVRPQQ